MAKKLVHNYTFDPSTNTVVIDYIYGAERLLLITNVTAGETIFAFNDATVGYSDLSYNYTTEQTTIVLTYDCSAMSSTDKLQIFVETDSTSFKPDETFVDPVSKIRVSQPENLIDTDFEYGLQSTKWETLELVKNIPTFFSRSGDDTYEISDVQTIEGSDIVTVTTLNVHDLLGGSPVIVIGSKNRTCDGAFVVTNVISTYIFQYKAKAIQTFTGSILDTYTQIFPGSVYQGTEFDLTGINAITTDGATTSTLTVNTLYPTNFTVGTSFFLSNSVGQVNYSFDSTAVTAENYNSNSSNSTNNVATGETGGFALGAVQPYNYSGIESVYFPADVAVNPGTGIETITIPSHGLTDNVPYLYVVGEGNTAIAGLTNYTFYYVRVVDANTIYITSTKNSTSRINLGSAGVSGGVMRSALIRAYKGTGGSTSSASESWTFEEAHGLSTNDPQPLMVWGSTGTLSANTNLLTPGQIYYCKTVRSTTSFSWSTSPGGAQINLSNVGTANAKWMIKVSALEDYDSIWFESHGLANDNVVTFAVNSGTVPTGLANGTNYAVEVINPNRIRFKNATTGALISISSYGSTTASYSVTSNTPNLNNDSIYAVNHGFQDGSVLKYDNNGGTTIPGLINGSSYYVFQASADRFKLATTNQGWLSTAKNITAFNNSTNVFTAASHGFTTGQAVQYLSATPITGLVNGAWYWVRSVSATTFTLHWTAAGASGNTDIVDVVGTLTGTHTVRSAALVDITGTGVGSQIFSALATGASDGVYTITENVNDTSFKIQSFNQVLTRTINITQAIDFTNNAIYYPDHAFVTGTLVNFTTSNTAIGGLTDSTDYYVIRISRNFFGLAETLSDAQEGNFITFTSVGVGTQTLIGSSVSGESVGQGTVSVSTGSTSVIGADTNFSAIFAPGDSFIIYRNSVEITKSVSSINAGTNQLTSTAHGFSTGDMVTVRSVTQPAPVENNQLYYVRAVDANTLTLHPTPTDATGNSNTIDITSTGDTVTLVKITNIGSVEEKTILTVDGKTNVTLTEPIPTAVTDLTYVVGTALYIRADGAAFHRAYDGGVELTPSTNPDSQMIRQTRKYFRYQSGKGIQVSFAVNFSPSVTIETMTCVGTTATITTRYPHRLSEGVNIHISGAGVSNGTNYWNGDFDIVSIVDAYNFTIELAGTPVDTVALGLIEYYVNSWSNSLLKCGLFDDQNGLYFEFDGQNINCVRRSSVQQLSGTANVTFKSGAIIGVGTKFTSQLNVNDKIVIKGQSYLVSKIASNTLLYVLPSYRGLSSQNCVITKTVDLKVPQAEWNVDPCDGTGPTGFVIDKHKIQMAYMDYSWYGAGKVRFGFKNQEGHVKYVHEFIHNNRETEAYMRSGNLPARYEIENLGTPTYVPALAHWGTSVIMDGRFDDDKAYVFTAGSNSITLTGGNSITVFARVETTNRYQIGSQGNWKDAGYALLIPTSVSSLNNIASGAVVAGANISNARARNPISTSITPYQPYQAGVGSRWDKFSNSTRNLLLIDQQPSGTAGTTSTYTITLSSEAPKIVYDIPLISIRLSPSVDNGTPGYLGEREIINRMQLILNSVGILSTHGVEISLRLNGQLDNKTWQRVTSPSLSQLVYHQPGDTINGGTIAYSFRAQGGSGDANRTPFITTADLGDIATLGNSIMGGDGVYPDGPDVLTVVARLVEDPSTVSVSNPLIVSGRISWSESQA